MKEVQKYGKEIGLEELKVLQMDVLQAVDEFCRNNNIRYSMACGTLLGAIRHKGYIPWDDDIDIYVPRDDYRRLVDIFPSLYKGRYKLTSLERSSLWDKPYAKIYDNKNVMVEDAVWKENIGVNIDVFPVDEVPDDESEWLEYNKKRMRQQKLFILKFVHLSFNRSIAKNVALLLFKIITCFYSSRKWAKSIDKMCKKYNGLGYNRYFECCSGRIQKHPFPKRLFDDLVYMEFEDRTFKAFADADCYLRNGYGDYMTLPPEEKRIPHHDFKAYWK